MEATARSDRKKHVARSEPSTATQQTPDEQIATQYAALKCDSHREELMLVAHCLHDPTIAKRIALQLDPATLFDQGAVRDCLVAIIESQKNGDGKLTRLDIISAIEPVLKRSVVDDEFKKRYVEARNDTRSGAYYLRRVIDRAGRRKILHELDPVALLKSTFNTSDAIARARETLLDISRNAATTTGRGGLLAKDYHDNVESLEDRLSGTVQMTFETGFTSLDAIVGGIQASSYNIIGARPSIGKTAVSINLVLALAKRGVRVMFVTLEVAYDKILELMTCCHNGLKKSLVHPAASQATRERLRDAFNAVHRLPIELHSNCNDIGQIVTLVEDAVTRDQNPVQAVFVDYAQIIRTKQRMRNDLDRLNLISEAFRVLKQDHKIALFVAAQLNRKSTEHAAPKLEDLKGTGDFEQDADLVLMLDRPNKELSEREDSTPGAEKTVVDNQLDIFIRKNRFGRTGKVTYHWDGSTGMISEMTENEAKAAAGRAQYETVGRNDRRSHRYEDRDSKQRSYSDGSMDTSDMPF